MQFDFLIFSIQFFSSYFVYTIFFLYKIAHLFKNYQMHLNCKKYTDSDLCLNFHEL